MLGRDLLKFYFDMLNNQRPDLKLVDTTFEVWYAEFDTDENGKISQAQFDAYLTRI